MTKPNTAEIFLGVVSSAFFVLFGVLVVSFIFLEFIMNPVLQAFDGYTPYMSAECLGEYWVATSSNAFFVRDGQLIPKSHPECKPERDYNPLRF